MISDEERNSDTDSGESSAQPPQAEKRQYHNLLERNRRNVLKYSFWRLRCSIPSLTKKKLVNNKDKASRAKILKRAIEYIKKSEKRKPTIMQDIREMERDNAFLHEQSLALSKADEEGDRDKMEAICRRIDEVTAKTYESLVSDTEDDEDSDDSEDDNVPNNEAVGAEWSSDNDQDNNEPQQGWSVNASEESESSESSESSEMESSSGYE